MLTRRALALGAAALALSALPASAQEKLMAVATFSILADFVREVGGDRIDVTTLVGPDGDAHVYSPTPADGRRLAEARIVFTNGLGYEGWLARLVKSSGGKAAIIEAAKGVQTLKAEGRHGSGHAHDHAAIDPHAWQNIGNAKIYVAAIRDE